ncbi:MAG: hypothetical protein Q9182_006235 [Xanthomendoza sp. 2 TL-2023]
MAIDKTSIEWQKAHAYENRATEIIIPHVVCLVFAVIAVALRFISRRIKAGIHLDDWICLLALVLLICEDSGVLLGTIKYGSAKHVVTLKDPVAIAKVTLAVQELYTAGTSAIKISTLILYYRIFGNSQRFRVALWSVGGFIAAYSFVQFLVILFQCHPVQGAWRPDIKSNCIQLNRELQVMGSLNAVTDIITVILPMFMLKGLQMKRSTKLQVAATFLVGGFVCIVSIYRVPTQAGISLVDFSCMFHIHRSFLGIRLTDFDLDTDVEACNWSFVELSVAICCACLITYRPLLSLGIDAVTGRSAKSSGKSSEVTPSPSEKRVWAKKLDPYDTDYTVSVDSDHSDSSFVGKPDGNCGTKETKVTVQEV